MMEQLQKYIAEILGIDIIIEQIPQTKLGQLPLYMSEAYNLSETKLLQQDLLLVAFRYSNEFSIMQTEKHFELLKNTFSKKVVLILSEITSFNRKRLIEKRINFIVPGKQLYLPELLMDLREKFANPLAKKPNATLLPSAQLMLLYFILYKNDTLEKLSFKELAGKLKYTQMAISKAVENLKQFKLITVDGEKEKYIRFAYNRTELWNIVEKQNLFSNPVLKKVYVDELPHGIPQLYCNTSALTEYTNMNPSKQQHYAVFQSLYYALQKTNVLSNENETEGKFCLEIWKYNPKTLVNDMVTEMVVVDPLSLYLSLQNNNDERIAMALEQIKEKYIW